MKPSKTKAVKKREIKKPSLLPVTINKDVWYYEGKKSLSFIVWMEGKCKEFRLPLKKLPTYFSLPVPTKKKHGKQRP